MLIAWKNIVARKWSSAKVALSILAMVIIMCIFTAYSVALAEENERVTKSYRSAHNVIVETTNPITDENLKKVKEIDAIDGVAQIAVCRNIKNMRGMTFELDGTSYQCDHEFYDYNLQLGIDSYVNNMHYGDFAFVKPNTKFVFSHHEEELGYRFEKKKSLLLGKDVVENNEIIVSEYFLEEFGFDSSVLGKNMKIAFNGNQFEMKIVGAMSKYFYQLTNTIDQHFIASETSDVFASYFANQSRYVKYQTKLYLKGHKLHSKLIDDVKGILINDIKNIKNIGFGSQYGLSMSTTVSIISSVLNGVMATVGLGIISALVLNIMYSMRFMMKKKSNFYAIMQVYGMDKSKMFNILFCEMFILSMFASIVAYGISYGLVYLFDYLLSSMVGVGVFFGWANFLITFAIAVVFTLIVVTMVSLINYSLYYKRSTYKMLKQSIEN